MAPTISMQFGMKGISGTQNRADLGRPGTLLIIVVACAKCSSRNTRYLRTTTY